MVIRRTNTSHVSVYHIFTCYLISGKTLLLKGRFDYQEDDYDDWKDDTAVISQEEILRKRFQRKLLARAKRRRGKPYFFPKISAGACVTKGG
jgi:hypothetical protein